MNKKKYFLTTTILFANILLATAILQLPENTQITQPDNSVNINFTQSNNFTTVNPHPGTTNFDNSNFTVESNADLNLDFYRPDVSNGSYVTNFSVNTQNGNNINFTFTGLKNNQQYTAKDEDSATILKQENSSSNGVFFFNQSSWTGNDNISLQNTGIKAQPVEEPSPPPAEPGGPILLPPGNISIVFSSPVIEIEPGTRKTQQFLIRNKINRIERVTVVEEQENGFCRFTGINPDLNSDSFGDNAVYRFNSNTTETFNVVVDIPPRKVLNRLFGNGTEFLTCGYRATAENGVAEDFNITVQLQHGFVEKINRVSLETVRFRVLDDYIFCRDVETLDNSTLPDLNVVGQDFRSRCPETDRTQFTFFTLPGLMFFMFLGVIISFLNPLRWFKLVANLFKWR